MKQNLRELLFLIICNWQQSQRFLHLNTGYPYPPTRGPLCTLMSPLEPKPNAGASPLLPSFIAGRALRPGGCQLLAHACTGVKCGTDQAPPLPHSREEGQKWQQHGPLPVFRPPPDWSEEAYTARKGKGSHNSQLVCYRKYGITSWLLLCPSNPPKIRDRNWDGVSLQGSQERLTARGGSSEAFEILQDLQLTAGGLA